MAIKHPTPLLDQLETGPWPSFVSDIKQEAEYRAANPDNVEFQVPADAPDDLPMFQELRHGFPYAERSEVWDVHYSRSRRPARRA